MGLKNSLCYEIWYANRLSNFWEHFFHHFNHISRSFETSQDFTIKRLRASWIEAQHPLSSWRIQSKKSPEILPNHSPCTPNANGTCCLVAIVGATTVLSCYVVKFLETHLKIDISQIYHACSIFICILLGLDLKIWYHCSHDNGSLGDLPYLDCK